MDWYPLYNSIRIAAVATVFVFFLGVIAAYFINRTHPLIRALGDVVLMLPLALPPTVTGWLLLQVLGPEHPVGLLWRVFFRSDLAGSWVSAVLVAVVVSFPMMYRTARGALAGFDEDLADAGRTLGRSELWVFWRVRVGACSHGLLAGVVLTFARAMGEYGATYMVTGGGHGGAATVSMTVFRLWESGQQAAALRWVTVNIVLSAIFLLLLNLVEVREGRQGGLL